MLSPIVTTNEMRRVEELAISSGCSEEMFMLEAGRKVFLRAVDWMEKKRLLKKVALLVGKGNKGGDALASGIYLLGKGISVSAFCLFESEECSILNQRLQERFVKAGGCLKRLHREEEISFQDEGLIIDGLLGTGFQGIVEPYFAHLIACANRSGKQILAIDIPSGLDGTTGEVRGEAIVADLTVSLGLLKIGFFLLDAWNFVGQLYLEDFGLPKQFLEALSPVAFATTPQNLSSYLPKIVRKRHKYEAGYVVGFSGSPLFRGAPKLAGLAALRSGAGIVRLFYHKEIGEAPFSLICAPWKKKDWDQEIKRASSLFIGPGMGRSKKSARFLQKEMRHFHQPCVFDADAIFPNLDYPKGSILTPHRGEVLRLLQENQGIDEKSLLAKCQKWVNQNSSILVLKGAPTFVFAKDQLPVIIPYGDPGMAKAGTGDVLTGIIAALLAQKVEPFHAAILGVSLHATAGTLAAIEKSSYGVIAEDLIHCLPHAIMEHRSCMVGLEPLNELKDAFF